MGEMERIEVRRIYAGRAAVFGLIYGAAIGLILGLINFILLISVGNGVINSINKASAAFGTQPLPTIGIGESFLFFVIVVLICTIWTCILCCISALIYNLIAKIGGPIHLGLVEFGKEE